MKSKVLRITGAIILTFFCGLLAHRFIYGWASMTTVAHHQYILKEAYKCLMKDPDVNKLKEKGLFQFPSLEQVLSYEGVDWIGEKGKLSLGKSGPGADSEEHSFWSWHYYNPRTREGQAHIQAGKYYERLKKKMLYPDQSIPIDFVVPGKPHNYRKDTTGARDAAYMAHFIADMSVPYHINGMVEEKARKHIKAKDGLLHEAVVGRTGKGPQDCWTEFKRWESVNAKSKAADWFDPWYFNYYEVPVIEYISHSHILWEGNYGTVRAHYKLPGYTQDFLLLQKGFGNGSSTTVSEFAVAVASYTDLRQADWWTIIDLDPTGKQAQEPLGHSIRNVYTAWRASFSCFKPEFEVEFDSFRNKPMLKINITSLSQQENPKEVRVRAKIKGGELNGPVWPVWHDVLLVPGDDYRSGVERSSIWEVVKADENAVVTVEVEGVFHNIPDAGRAVLTKKISEVPEEADLSGTWNATYTDRWQTAEIRWEISGGSGKWTVEQTLEKSNHPYWRNQELPQKIHSLTLTTIGPGELRFEGDGGDPNPGNPGHFTQSGSGSFYSSTILLEGQHVGTSITHPIKYVAVR